MGKTSIEWVKNADGEQGSVYNPVRGCSRISPGCGGGGSFSGTPGQKGGCYAEVIAARFSDPGQPFHGFAERTPNGPRWTGKVALIPSLLDAPLRKRAPTTYFCSMFDLFHEDLSNEDIADVFAVMTLAHWHTFQVLTKRSGRALEFLSRWAAGGRHIWTAAQRMKMPRGMDKPAPGWPLPNVHLGVSVESAKYKPRLDDLRACPAAVRFASLEPLLEDLGTLDLTSIHQVIVGAESGHHARPMREDWVRSIRDQAVAQGVAMFYKQRLEGGRKVSLPMLDGRQWAELPATVRP